MLTKLVAISAFGVAGVLLRFFLDQVISKKFSSTFPWGIFVINVLGCAFIGVLFAVRQKASHPILDPALAIGFAGGFTTFSTFSLDLFRLAFIQNQITLAVIYGLISPVVGLVATWASFNVTTFLSK